MDDNKPQDQAPIDYQKDIHNVSMEDIAAEMEEPGINPPEEPETPAEPEKPAEPAIEAKPEEPPVPPLDTEKLKEEISQQTAERVIKALAPEEASAKEKKDLVADAPWVKEDREPSWQEALDYMADKNKEQLKDELKQEVLQDLAKEADEEDAKETQARETAAKQETDRKEAWNKQWTTEFSRLEDSGKLIKVNPNDVSLDKDNVPNDPGRRQRYNLLVQMRDYNEKNPDSPILNLVEFHTLQFKDPNAPEPGATQPVAGARRSVAPAPRGEFTYQEIHGKDLDSIARGE